MAVAHWKALAAAAALMPSLALPALASHHNGVQSPHHTEGGAEALLSSSIHRLGQILGRDLVVVNEHQIIQADTVAAEVGTRFDHDPGDEVGATLRDGKPRSFREQSQAYPAGITLQVEPLRDGSGRIIGALIWQPAKP